MILAPASLGCLPKRLIQIVQYLQGEDVLSATSSNFLFRRERVRPSRIIEFILRASMRPFYGCAQVPGLG